MSAPEYQTWVRGQNPPQTAADDDTTKCGRL
jgi:hypothetical protein